MNTRLMSRIRSGAVATAFVLIGSALAACGGGGSSAPSVPAVPQSNHPAAHMLAHMDISRANAAKVASLVRSTAAYASPIKGGSIRHIRAMTSAAGNDLTNNGGPVVTGATVYNILVNGSDESSWGGQISQFENDLFGSGMINILDQYIGQSATGAFSNGGDVTVTYNTSSQLADQDIYNIVHQVAQTYGGGYNAVYNVFLQNGVQQCSQSAGGCYAQQYCAYHGNTDFSDVGHVLYTVEPYQNIPGCQVSNQPSPNGVLADSTASTLSHETFETITDPDVPNNVAWYNQNGGEIGDLCAPAAGVPTGNVTLGADTWEIQMEYDNNISDCSYTP